jgi:septal ring factor EnvC (AmiA/AmiB activator)
MRPSFPSSAVSVLLLLLLPWGLSAQEPSPDFSSIDNNLEKLESLITDTLNTNETLTLQLADLSLTLSGREQLINEQEALLRELRTQLAGMSETYRTLSSSSRKYESSSKFWMTFTVIGIPAAALISGLTVGIVMGLR